MESTGGKPSNSDQVEPLQRCEDRRGRARASFLDGFGGIWELGLLGDVGLETFRGSWGPISASSFELSCMMVHSLAVHFLGIRFVEENGFGDQGIQKRRA